MSTPGANWFWMTASTAAVSRATGNMAVLSTDDRRMTCNVNTDDGITTIEWFHFAVGDNQHYRDAMNISPPLHRCNLMDRQQDCELSRTDLQKPGTYICRTCSERSDGAEDCSFHVSQLIILGNAVLNMRFRALFKSELFMCFLMYYGLINSTCILLIPIS